MFTLKPASRVAMAILVFVCGYQTMNAQVLECPPNITLDCSQNAPAPDPGLITVTSNCKTPNCCDGQLSASDYCTADLSSCMKVALTCIDVDANCNPVFKFKVYNTCQNALSNIAFTIPAGVTATTPVDGDTYISPCGGSYNVETPNNGPDAGTLKFEGTIENGDSDCFEFTFEGLTELPDFIDVNPKYGPNDDFLSVSTMGCGNASIISATHVVDKQRNLGCKGFGICRIYKVEFDCPAIVSGRNSCEQVILRTDDTSAPTFTFTPSNKTIGCGEPVVFDPPTATDDCGIVPIQMAGDAVTGGCPGATTYRRRWKAIDDCGNSTGAVEQVITVPGSCCMTPVQLENREGEAELADQKLNLDVHPNPAVNSPLTIALPGAGEQEVALTIYDVQGKVLLTRTMVGTSSLVIEPAQLGIANGLIFVQAVAGDQSATQKVFIR